MDKPQDAIKARLKAILSLPLEDREAIPHDKFMELTREFMALQKEVKELTESVHAASG